MQLTPEEAQEAYSALSRSLRSVGLTWVVAEVEEKVALGKVQSKRLRTDAHQNLWEPERYRRRPAPKKSEVYAVSEEYSPAERLEILLEAVILAVPKCNSVGQATFKNFHDLDFQGEFQFEPEADVDESFHLSRGEITERDEAAKQLLGLIQELCEDYHADAT